MKIQTGEKPGRSANMASTVYSSTFLLFVTTVLNVRSDICPYYEAYYDEQKLKTMYIKRELRCERECCDEGANMYCCYHGQDQQLNTTGLIIGVLFGAAVVFGLCLMCAKLYHHSNKTNDPSWNQVMSQNQGGNTNIAFITEVQHNPYSLPPPSYEECTSGSVYFEKSCVTATPSSDLRLVDDQQPPDYHSYVKVFRPDSSAAVIEVAALQSSVPDNNPS